MSFPIAFIKQINELLQSESEDFFSALKEPAPVSIRLNPLKKKNLKIYDSPEWTGESVPWSSFGKYLSERPSFTFDPQLHAGCYYVQEASSMFVEKAIDRAIELLGNDAEPVKMLDVCAAPGGKSTLAISVLPEGSLLVANELIRTRANILAENLIKWGYPNILVTQSDTSAFSDLKDCFDLVLADVPCSGEGMFRKDPNAISEWSEDNVRICASRQRDIIKKCWPSIKQGGYLIYSTCTYNTLENEQNISWICKTLGAEVVEIEVSDSWGISGAKGDYSGLPVYRFFPHKTKGEGFFLALLRKDSDESEGSDRNKVLRSEKKSSKQKAVIQDNYRSFLREKDIFEFSLDRLGRIVAIDKRYVSILSEFEKSLKIIQAGITIGEIKGKDLLPDISLALSNALDLYNVETLELDKTNAICYLRREMLILPETCGLGWILIKYEGYPLGWIKNIGSRANNAWPNEWRIRT